MPIWIGPALKYGEILALIVVVAGIIYWVVLQIRDHQRARDQNVELEANLARSEAARRKEQEIADAARKVRDAPGPRVPTLDELRRPSGGPTPPA